MIERALEKSIFSFVRNTLIIIIIIITSIRNSIEQPRLKFYSPSFRHISSLLARVLTERFYGLPSPWIPKQSTLGMSLAYLWKIIFGIYFVWSHTLSIIKIVALYLFGVILGRIYSNSDYIAYLSNFEPPCASLKFAQLHVSRFSVLDLLFSYVQHSDRHP